MIMLLSFQFDCLISAGFALRCMPHYAKEKEVELTLARGKKAFRKGERERETEKTKIEFVYFQWLRTVLEE